MKFDQEIRSTFRSELEQFRNSRTRGTKSRAKFRNSRTRGTKSRAKLCNVVQCCAILCNIVQYCAILCNIVQYCAILRNIVQSCAILCNVVQYCATLCNIVQCCAILCHIVQFGSNFDDIISPERASGAPEIESKSVLGPPRDAPWRPRASQGRLGSILGARQRVPGAPRERPEGS